MKYFVVALAFAIVIFMCGIKAAAASWVLVGTVFFLITLGMTYFMRNREPTCAVAWRNFVAAYDEQGAILLSCTLFLSWLEMVISWPRYLKDF